MHRHWHWLLMGADRVRASGLTEHCSSSTTNTSSTSTTNTTVDFNTGASSDVGQFLICKESTADVVVAAVVELVDTATAHGLGRFAVACRGGAGRVN